jgi:predicted nucleic acid-binding protein
MVDPASGPFLFDTSSESWLARTRDQALQRWFGDYLSRHPILVSAVTIIERIRGYALLWQRGQTGRQAEIETARIAYLGALGRVWPVDQAVAVVAGEVMALLPNPPTSPRRTHRFVESRQDRLVRWRFDGIIAATALVAGMAMIHNNPADFESIRTAIERVPHRFPKLGPLELIRCSSLA